MNLKVPGAILPLGCEILSTRVKTVGGVGTTPLRRTRVKAIAKKKGKVFTRFNMRREKRSVVSKWTSLCT